MNNSRNNILQKLQQQNPKIVAERELSPSNYNWAKEDKIKQFTNCMSKVHGEVIHLNGLAWTDWINSELPKRNLKNILIGTNDFADQLLQNSTSELKTRSYIQDIEDWKHELFHKIDVSVTSCIGGIAETGSLVLWPDADEPRLMSIVPPVHIVVLDAEKLYETFAELVEAQSWSKQMPTNALLISGPSKTADIEQTLAYGIHGPQQLIVLII